ncbi:MAG: hypothetical protein ISS83_01100 [Candidatus Pacebacteria bacterium]|nr:hypothetical protein [Candidatus Paceibacterota bacterium]
MEMTDERFNKIGCQVLIGQFLRDTSLHRLVKLDENDIKKRVGQFAQEMDGLTDDVMEFVTKDELLEFVKRLMGKVTLMVNRVNDMTQQIKFR